MTVKSPAVSGVTATSVVFSAAMSVSIFSGFDMKPCTRSVLLSRRITGSPFLSVISLGENSNFFAVISITFGLSLAWMRLTIGATPMSPISHTPARRMMLTILSMVVVFIFLLVLCVVASMFEHLIHSDSAREFGRRELHFLDLQIAAVGVAVDAPDSQVLERLRLVERRRLFRWRRCGIGEREDQRAGRVHFCSAGLVEVLAMNMAVEHRHVFIRRQRVHHVVAVAREPFPFGLE